MTIAAIIADANRLFPKWNCSAHDRHISIAFSSSGYKNSPYRVTHHPSAFSEIGKPNLNPKEKGIEAANPARATHDNSDRVLLHEPVAHPAPAQDHQ
jgi:hypothetical protein